MADIGEPLKRYRVVPLRETVPPTREPVQAPPPSLPARVPSSPSVPAPTTPAEPERVE